MLAQSGLWPERFGIVPAGSKIEGERSGPPLFPRESVLSTDQFYTLAYLGVFVVVGLLFALAPLALAYMLAPHRPGRIKRDTYECGLEAKGESWIQFRVQYYVIALAFLIFDLEAVFLFPAAMVFRAEFVEQGLSLGLLAAIEIALFILVLALGLVYAWSKKLLEWK